MADFKQDIEKYIKGELTSAEMHALEKRALTDPFLADALEGAESITPEDFTTDISEINHKLSSQRKKSFWITPLRIAAGIALLIVSIFFIDNFNRQSEQLALQKEKTTSPNTSRVVDSISKKNEPKLQSLDQPKEETIPETIADLRTESGPVITKTDGSGAAKPALTETIDSNSDDQAKASQAGSSELLKIAREEELSEGKKIAATQPIQQDFNKETADKDLASRAQSRKSKLADDIPLQKVVSGQVTSAEDGLPLPGVNVTVKGTTNGTVTDMQGNYSIPLESEKQRLVFSFIGLQPSEVLPTDQSTVNVKLLEDMSQLSEVVVTGQGFKSDRAENETPVIKLAEPLGGRKAYDKYLETNMRYPQQALQSKVKGKVTIEFTVASDGTLHDFSVMKSLGYGCDEEVTRLVKEGPKWSPTTEDNIAIESSVRVRMKFDPAKVKK